MSNHYHLVLRPLVDGEMSRFMGWIGGTHTMRYHEHYHTSGLGHAYQQRYKSFPIQDDEHFFVMCRYVERNALRAELADRAEHWRWGSLWRWPRKPEPAPRLLSPWPLARLPKWVERVNSPLSKTELASVRLSAQRGRPLGDDGWDLSQLWPFLWTAGIYHSFGPPFGLLGFITALALPNARTGRYLRGRNEHDAERLLNVASLITPCI